MDKILVVDDEEDLREILEFNLQSAGYTVETAASAEAALKLLSPDTSLILLDVMLGGMSGFAFARKLRTELHSTVPIVFLTARGTENDLLTGFSAGGDDYIRKPFSIHEVLARVKAVLRRGQPETAEQSLQLGDLVINLESKRVFLGNKEILLSPKEFGILALLVGKPDHIFDRETILSKVWKGEACVLDRTIDVHIARVRKKLGSYGNHLVNRQGYGYCFRSEGTSQPQTDNQ